MLLAHELAGDQSHAAVVLIHGITDSRQRWSPLIGPLAANHRVLAIDLRGHGDSPHGDAYDPISYATDVVETAAAAGIREPLVVGHSLGGVVASAFAAIAPCAGVVNVDQSLRLSAFKAALGQIAPMLRDPATFQQTMEMVIAGISGPFTPTDRQFDQSVVLGTWAAVLDSTEAELDATVGALASAITVPYLALYGDDPGAGYADWLQQLVPTATVEVWAGLGHYLHLAEPDRFLARVAEFETRVRG